MRQLFFILVASLLSIGSIAQNGNIKGRVTDSTYKKAFPLATVTVFRAADTSIVTYRLTNDAGEFKISGLPFNMPLRLLVTYSGHGNYRHEFMLNSEHASLDFDSIQLMPVANQLEEVLVVAERPPVVIRKDTIEFNANSFKTLPNALVEDLLKKLPGVQIDGDGNIMVNGKPVNRILVDGKAFFGDDPKMATRNLPANVIDKVQVVDDKEEAAQSATGNLNDIGKVINLTFKKGVKKGWFGKVYGGIGSSELYDAGGIANIFRDTLQLSVLAYANNLNKSGFSYQDLQQIGGFSRNRNTGGNTSISMTSSGTGSSVSLNGINFGGSSSGGGVTTSRGAGINMNHTPSTKRTLFAQYFFGKSIADQISDRSITQYYNDTVLKNVSKILGRVTTNSHNAGLGFQVKPDSVTTFMFNASYVLAMGDEGRQSAVNTNNNKLGDVSQGNILQDNESVSQSYRHAVNYIRLSKKKKGGRFYLYHSLDVNNRKNDNLTDGKTEFYYPFTSTNYVQQLRNEKVPRVDGRLYGVLMEPIGKKFFFSVVSNIEYGRNKNEIITYGNSSSGKYDSLVDNLSSQLRRETGRVSQNFTFEYRYKDWSIAPGIGSLWQGSQVQSPLLTKAFRKSGYNIIPIFRATYKQFNFSYDRGIVLPGYQYLIAITNNSDPYFITKTNPNLLPSRRDNFSMNYYINDVKRSLNIFFVAQTLFTQNDIVDDIRVDENGVQQTTPVNQNGSKRYYTNYSINKQYKRSQRFILGLSLGGYQTFGQNRLLFNGLRSWTRNYLVSNFGSVNLNWNDKLELNSSFSTTNNFTRYSDNQFTKLNLFNYDLNSELIVRYPKHVIWESRVTWTKYAASAPGSPSHLVRWNAGVNLTMLKDERGVLNFRVYDILDQNNNIQTSVNRNLITVTRINVLPRYFMATFTYNIRTTGSGRRKVGGWLNN